MHHLRGGWFSGKSVFEDFVLRAKKGGGGEVRGLGYAERLGGSSSNRGNRATDTTVRSEDWGR